MPPALSSAVVWPAKIHTPPPSPVLPAPTVTRMDPALPLVARSEPTEMLPLLPTLAVPELKLKRPDTPLSPALTARTVMVPLDVDEPYPVASSNAPPLIEVPSPLVASKSPPSPLEEPLPKPPVNTTSPPNVSLAVDSPATM